MNTEFVIKSTTGPKGLRQTGYAVTDIETGVVVAIFKIKDYDGCWRFAKQAAEDHIARRTSFQ